MFHINLDRTIPNSLVNQVYGQIREMILGGALKPGEKLPSTRELASSLAVSRNVVTTAYELLNAEGFLDGKHGSGSYVAPGAYWETQGDRSPGELPAPLRRRGADNSKTAPSQEGIDFRSGIPALDQVPRNLLARLLYQTWRTAPDAALGYGDPAGSPELQQAIAVYLHKSRGVVCHPAQIIITSGAVQGLALVAKALVRPGVPVLIEDPSNCDIAKIFEGQGAQIVPVPVDEQGIRTTEISAGIQPALTVVTPSHQFPLGGILPIQRRIELVRLARETESLIIEDDYDSEFRYEGPPVSSLQGLDPERVIYLGTFSKILLPAVRLGYIVVPPQLVAACAALKRLDDLHSNTLNQLALAEFIGSGLLARHTARMKKEYRHKRDMLRTVLTQAFAEKLRLSGVSTGLHLVAQIAGVYFDEPLIRRLAAGGVVVYPVEAHAVVKGRHTDKIILGFGHLSLAEIEAGVGRLKEVLSSRIW